MRVIATTLRLKILVHPNDLARLLIGGRPGDGIAHMFHRVAL